ncbi:hypothetical protein DICPUDRAFT_83074 [Dictyostelium purpureum]|uniref:MPN domain-containing protein n=1 Tax=Dictyostelium purpureum TaxID=5786 RepID=F0ZYG4_DICPU|nr:uncharacterized protein DICPUDRAFT_83074 [Dictyostelium purpureum]EGC31023.1 hypothetical protein DICPUDRAFT_83074 [Dictyostelium purpureum]|eukprot:XP_003292461.1 hypothetical protein DICPUDRAFT_83074 [Dictyostelium purpureum]
MIIGIRGPSGTTRVEINDSAIVKDLLVKLKNSGVGIDGKSISKSPRDPPLSAGDRLSAVGIKNGDLLYLVGSSSNEESSNNSSNSNNNSNNNNNNNNIKEEYIDDRLPNGLTIRCKHLPGDKCVFCSEAQGLKKCNHPENTTCPNCQDKKFKGRRLKWLCNHPPGGKCSNCLKVPKNVSYKCNHGPTATCVNCMGKEEEEEASQETNNNNIASSGGFSPKVAIKSDIKTKCLHGPNAKCVNCLPKDDPNAPTLPTRKCKNHGIHGSCVECIEWRESLKMKLKSQDNPHCPGALVDFTSANIFQQYVQSKKFEVQRVGFLYGNILQDGSVVIDSIYEPPQECKDGQTVTILNDPRGEKVESIASMLGMTRVGWIFSHPSRKYVMSSKDIIQAAAFQNKYGSSFATLILSANTEGQSNIEAFQVSDQALALEKRGEFLQNQPDPTKCKLKTAVFEEGTETNNADNNFFIVTVPLKAREDKSIFKCNFPVENRQPGTTISDLASYKLELKDTSPLEFFSDFHFLIFLLENELFDFSVDFPVICESIQKRSSENLIGYNEIISYHVGDLIGHDQIN